MDTKPFDFDGAYGSGYEQLARTLIPGYLSSFRQALALLQRRLGPIGPNPRVLVVGAGTGIEIVTFKTHQPGWLVTGVDPSPQMIEIARRRVSEAGVDEGVEFVCGEVGDLREGGYAAATSFNVMHFIPDDGSKQAFLRGIAGQLAPGGSFVLFDLHGDRSAPGTGEMYAAWRRHWKNQGMDSAARTEFEARIEAGIHWVSEARIRELLAGASFEDARLYFRALVYGGWIARRAAV